MIKQLKINNFKSICKLDIKLKKLNILCGENASGKTSIIHSILLCSQNNTNGKDADGEIIKIGNYEELKNNNQNGEIKISLYGDDSKKTLIYKRNDDPTLNQDNLLIVNAKNEKDFEFEKSIFYLSSIRTGVMDTYQKGNYLFGSDGAETISFLYNHKDDLLSKKYMTLFNKNYKNSTISENRKFIEHVRFWMEYITKENISISSIDRTNQYVLLYGNSRIRPINTGSGYSFLLPVVITCLGAVLLEENPTIIIENPEIFLHPEAQKKLMKFFSFCKYFCQIIIETHSEYIIKSTVEYNKNDTNIFVAKKDESGYTSISKFRGNEFKTNSYMEIIYRSFGIVTPELHILLYGLLQQKFNNINNWFESSIGQFDTYLASLNTIQFKQWEHLYNNGSKTIYKTLPTFIRNKIDHPEAKDPNTGKNYYFTDKELKKSIDFLLAQL